MTTIPKSDATLRPASESTEEQFRRLSADWQRETAHLSSSTDRHNHPAYQEIIALGPAALPYLLRDLEVNDTHWFSALRTITGANPIPASAAGDVPKMASAWLEWAKS